MTPEIRYRLTLVEKSFQRFERPTFSDEHLISVMRSKQARPEHLQALCDRIAEPLLASLMFGASLTREDLNMGHEPPEVRGRVTAVAVALGFEDDSQMPESPYYEIDARGGFPQPTDDVWRWSDRVLGVLLSDLVKKCGGLDRMREMVSEIRDFSYVPIYTVEEADVLADLVETVEILGYYFDAPVLVWRGPDGDLFCSRKGVETGQKWTSMSPEGAEINGQTPYRPLIQGRV